LICRWDGRELVDVSRAYIDRLLHRAELRAGVRAWPAHAWRRSTATLLRERGADWEDVSAALTHRSPETTRLYVDPLVRQRRLASALRLIDSCGERVKA
jgi:integrase